MEEWRKLIFSPAHRYTYSRLTECIFHYQVFPDSPNRLKRVIKHFEVRGEGVYRQHQEQRVAVSADRHDARAPPVPSLSGHFVARQSHNQGGKAQITELQKCNISKLASISQCQNRYIPVSTSISQCQHQYISMTPSISQCQNQYLSQYQHSTSLSSTSTFNITIINIHINTSDEN